MAIWWRKVDATRIPRRIIIRQGPRGGRRGHPAGKGWRLCPRNPAAGGSETTRITSNMKYAATRRRGKGSRGRGGGGWGGRSPRPRGAAPALRITFSRVSASTRYVNVFAYTLLLCVCVCVCVQYMFCVHLYVGMCLRITLTAEWNEIRTHFCGGFPAKSRDFAR